MKYSKHIGIYMHTFYIVFYKRKTETECEYEYARKSAHNWNKQILQTKKQKFLAWFHVGFSFILVYFPKQQAYFQFDICILLTHQMKYGKPL